MATADKLKKYVTAIAEAIRAKEGSTELINPQDFVNRIKGLGAGGGIPDVPTLECWKIDLSSLSDDDKQYHLGELTFFATSESAAKMGKCIILSEIDGNIYGGIGPLRLVGSGSEEIMANIFYVAFMNVGEQNYFVESIQWLKEGCLDIYGEQISLSNFLSMAAQAQSYENQLVWE